MERGVIGIQQGATIAVDPVTGEPAPGADPLLGGLVYGGGDIGNDILDDLGEGATEGVAFIGFEAPLPAGTYTVWLNEGGRASTATLNFIVSRSAVAEILLSIADAATIGEDGDTGDATLVFGLTATDSFSGAVTVTYDAADDIGLTQAVSKAWARSTSPWPGTTRTTAATWWV